MTVRVPRSKRSCSPMSERVAAFWCRIPSRPNFGDALTPWLIRQLTGEYPRFSAPDDPREKYFVTGSVIAFAGSGSKVWGSGIMNRHDVISPAATLLAVRGPLTRARALACGADCPEVFGDPALLLPRFYPRPKSRKAVIGVVPHFSDAPALVAAWRQSEELALIDIQNRIEGVIDEIASCSLVASSSLHAIIAAHAYGIPAVWLKFRDLPSGDDSKFDDYYLSIGCEPQPPVRVGYADLDAAALDRFAVPPPLEFDLEPLWNACPFRSGA